MVSWHRAISCITAKEKLEGLPRLLCLDDPAGPQRPVAVIEPSSTGERKTKKKNNNNNNKNQQLLPPLVSHAPKVLAGCARNQDIPNLELVPPVGFDDILAPKLEHQVAVPKRNKVHGPCAQCLECVLVEVVIAARCMCVTTKLWSFILIVRDNDNVDRGQVRDLARCLGETLWSGDLRGRASVREDRVKQDVYAVDLEEDGRVSQPRELRAILGRVVERLRIDRLDLWQLVSRRQPR